MKKVAKSKAVLFLVAFTALVCAASSAHSVPKPSEVQTSWQFDFRIANPPQPILVLLPGKTQPETFWYMRYTVTNRTGQDRVFVPDFVLYTDSGQLIRAGSKVPAPVFGAIKKLHNAVLLTDITGMTGKLLQGEDNAKDGVAIFRDFDPDAGAFDIFVGGLSGETVELTLPRPIEVVELDAKTGEKKKVTKTSIVLAKSLHLPYEIPGEAKARSRTKVKAGPETWVMR